MKIPFVDLKSQYISIKDEIDHAIQAVIDTTAFIKGDFVKKFEADFLNSYKAKYFISCANGTDAIFLARTVEPCPDLENSLHTLIVAQAYRPEA